MNYIYSMYVYMYLNILFPNFLIYLVNSFPLFLYFSW